MKLVLCSGRSLASWILRWYMGSRWSHSAIWDEAAGFVYHATLFGGGVRRQTESEFFAEYHEHRVIDVPVQDAFLGMARAWLEDQVGKPYDWTALAGIYFRRDWQAEDSWFCSEMSETFRSKFSRPVFSEHADRITPYHQDIVIQNA